METSPASAPRVTQPQIRRAATASFVGTAIEWYDFFIYGTAAALVLGPQFFPSGSSLASTLAAFSTFAVGFLARPLGGVVMGHFGDRVGRKAVLVFSLLLMGTATVLIGVLPTYETAGVLAPILLVTLRFAQGLGVGGEWGGAVLLAVEYAPARKRGFYGSFPQMGVPAGVILANLVFLTVIASFGVEEFIDWAWRVPFLLSIVLVIVGLFIRSRIGETPSFAKAKAREREPRMPIVDVLRKHSLLVVLAGGTFLGNNACGYIMLVYILSYGTGNLGLEQSTMLVVVVSMAVVWLIMTPLTAIWSDRVGRRKVFILGGVLGMLWALPLFWLIDTGSLPLMVLAGVVTALALGLTYGPQAALFAELFPAHLRYSGASLGYQVGAILGGGMAPLIAAALYGATGSSMSTALYIGVMWLIGVVCIVLLKETAHGELDSEPEKDREPEKDAEPS